MTVNSNWKQDNLSRGRQTIIYIVGNPLVKEDALPLKLLPALKKRFSISFKEFDPLEEIEGKNDTLIFLDTVKGIKKTVLFTDLDSFKLSSAVSVHDYDLNMHLKLLLKTGRIKKILIIGIPEDISEKQALADISKHLGGDLPFTPRK